MREGYLWVAALLGTLRQAAQHGMRLSATRLAVSKDARVVAVHTVGDDGAARDCAAEVSTRVRQRHTFPFEVHSAETSTGTACSVKGCTLTRK
jgi:hypothetical protein